MSINSPTTIQYIYLDCTKWYWQVDYSDVPQRTQRSASTSSATASYTSAHLHHLDRSNNRMDNDQVIIKLFYSFSSPQKKEKNPENPCHKIITKFEETAGGLAKADTVPPWDSVIFIYHRPGSKLRSTAQLSPVLFCIFFSLVWQIGLILFGWNQYRSGDMQHHPLMNHHHHRDPATVHVVGGGMGTQSHRSSRGSDTSSAYSGSDTMHSSVPSSDQVRGSSFFYFW